MIRDQASFGQLLDTLRRFVAERLVPNEARRRREDRVPAELVEEMKALGLFGLAIPEEFGGLGLTMEEEVLVAIEIGRTSPAFRSVFGTNNGIGSQGIIIDGTPAQKRAWLPRLASGEIIASFALTEPEAGSDAASLKTSARRDGDNYVAERHQALHHQCAAMPASSPCWRAPIRRKGAGGISAFIVERHRPASRSASRTRKMGQQGAHSCDVIFEDCRVPAANDRRRRGQGLQDRDEGAGSRPPAHRRGLRRRGASG